jgi:hypothetical protein
MRDLRLVSTYDFTADVRQLPDQQCETVLSAERTCRRSRPVSDRDVQRIAVARRRAGFIQGGLHHAAGETPKPDTADVRIYQSVSNLLVLYKQLERLTARQLLGHLGPRIMLPD